MRLSTIVQETIVQEAHARIHTPPAGSTNQATGRRASGRRRNATARTTVRGNIAGRALGRSARSAPVREPESVVKAPDAVDSLIHPAGCGRLSAGAGR